MASTSTANDWDEIEDYTEEEMADIMREVEKYKREALEESDVEVGENSDAEGEEHSDPEDDVPLATLQTTWRPAAQPTVRQFVLPTDPSQALPDAAKPLVYLFGFLGQALFEIAADETNRYAEQKSLQRGLLIPCGSPPHLRRCEHTCQY